ncbi:hypothetical protein ACW5F0_10245 [Luteimonas sp. A534]
MELSGGDGQNPISRYFEVTEHLKRKLLSAGEEDAATLGLLVIGVISALEFYIRSLFAHVYLLCPLSQRHSELVAAPLGGLSFHAGTGHPYLLSAFEHESLADSKKIKAYCEKYLGLKIASDRSVEVVLADFDKLCELRHCLVHANGYVGLKASRELGLPGRSPRKILFRKSLVFEVLKVAHNVVRAVNRSIADQAVDRWVDFGVLDGTWSNDKARFTSLFALFRLSGEDGHSGIAYNSYRTYQRSIRARASSEMASVGI